MTKAQTWGESLIGIASIAGLLLIVSGLVIGLGYEKAGNNLPKVDIETNNTLELAGAPGETVEFFVTRRMLGDTRWRSPEGIDIVLEGQSQQVIEPRDKEWGESLSRGRNQSNDPADIKGRLRIGNAAEVGSVLRGAFAGEMTVAMMSSSDGFDNVTQGVNNPVQLRVVSQAKSSDLRAERERSGMRMAVIATYVAGTMALIIVVSAIGAWLLLRR